MILFSSTYSLSQDIRLSVIEMKKFDYISKCIQHIVWRIFLNKNFGVKSNLEYFESYLDYIILFFFVALAKT